MPKFFAKVNLSLFLLAFLLSILGLLAIYGVSTETGLSSPFWKQVFFLIFSVLIFFLLPLFDLRFLKRNSYIVLSIYFISIVLLGGLFFSGRIRGIRGWYKIGFLSFDPTPFVIISLIILLAKYFSRRHEETFSLKPIAFSFLYSAIPILLVAIQPDLGSAFIIFSVWFGMVVFSGLRLRHFFIILLLIIFVFSLGWQFWLKDYQKDRIISFLKPNVDPRGISWNRNQSKIAIGSGGLFGKGIKNNSQSRYGFLPEAKTDFIFSATGEEFGFLGLSIVIVLLSLLFFQIMKISLRAKNNFLSLFSAGTAFWLLAQSFINIGMALGFLPIMGIPLPFISYGGSNLLGFYLSLAVINNLSKNNLG